MTARSKKLLEERTKSVERARSIEKELDRMQDGNKKTAVVAGATQKKDARRLGGLSGAAHH